MDGVCDVDGYLYVHYFTSWRILLMEMMKIDERCMEKSEITYLLTYLLTYLFFPLTIVPQF